MSQPPTPGPKLSPLASTEPFWQGLVCSEIGWGSGMGELLAFSRQFHGSTDQGIINYGLARVETRCVGCTHALTENTYTPRNPPHAYNTRQTHIIQVHICTCMHILLKMYISTFICTCMHTYIFAHSYVHTKSYLRDTLLHTYAHFLQTEHILIYTPCAAHNTCTHSHKVTLLQQSGRGTWLLISMKHLSCPLEGNSKKAVSDSRMQTHMGTHNLITHGDPPSATCNCRITFRCTTPRHTRSGTHSHSSWDSPLHTQKYT